MTIKAKPHHQLKACKEGDLAGSSCYPIYPLSIRIKDKPNLIKF